MSEGESIKIVTHSLGTAFSRGFTKALQEYADEHNITISLEYQVDIAAFDGSVLPADINVQNSEFMSGNADKVANWKSIGRSSDIPRANAITTEKGTGHGILNFENKVTEINMSENNNSIATEAKPIIYEEKPQENNAYLLLVFSLLYALSMGGCSNSNDNKKDKRMQYAMSNEVYKRDSLYLTYTIREFIKEKYAGFEYFTNFKIPLEEVDIIIDSILYSPDSLKMFAFSIEKVPDYENQNKSEYFYSGKSLIGFRDDLNQPWKIYVAPFFAVGGVQTYERAKEAFRNYYFEKFKTQSQYIVNEKGEWILARFKYNLDDPEFWTKSIVWQKGLKNIPGLYLFQVSSTGKVKDDVIEKWGIEHYIVPYLEIDYPDSLLKSFKGN